MGSVALPALIAFLAVLPGFIFLNRYNSFEGETLPYPPFGAATALAVSVALIANALWLVLIDRLPWFRPVSTEVILQIATGNELANSLKQAIPSLQTILSYFLSLYAAVFLAAEGLKGAVSKFGLDILYSPLRFHSHWFNLLRGRNRLALQALHEKKPPNARLPDSSCAEFETFLGSLDVEAQEAKTLAQDAERHRFNDYFFARVDLIVKIEGEGAFIYKGIVDAFYFDRKGGLDRLVLTDASRRRLQPDGNLQGDETFKPIYGDILIIRYEHIININIAYENYLAELLLAFDHGAEPDED